MVTCMSCINDLLWRCHCVCHVTLSAPIFFFRSLCCCVCGYFQVVLASEVTPPQTNGWKVTVAGILLLLLVASCVQLSLVANITKLPKVRIEPAC